MSKNNMRTSKEKEKILKEFYLGKLGRNEICRKYNISTRTLADWRIKYEESGIDGLKSNTGKSKGGNKGLGLKKGKTKIKNHEVGNRKCKIKKRLSSERRWESKGIRYYIRQDYEIIEELKSQYSIVSLCKEMSVSKSGYYKWIYRKKIQV